MQRLVFTNANGVSIDLTKEPYGITKWTGFANANLNIQSQQVPFHDGSVFLDALIDNRNLSVTLAMHDDNDLEKRYELRRELISALNPKLGEGVLVYTNDFISKQIKCIPKIPLFDTHNSNTKGTPKASLAWTACDPYWEDTEETVVFLKNSIRTLVENKGDVPCSIKSKIIVKNTENPQIKNLTTNQLIKLNGTFNDSISINTGFGNKTIDSEKLNVELLAFPGGSKIIYSNKLGLFVSILWNKILTSKDLMNWNTISIDFNFYAITYSEDLELFVGVGSSLIATSSDGVEWTSRTLPSISGYGILYGVTYSEDLGLFVAVGKEQQNVNIGYVVTSSDGINWTLSSTDMHLSEMSNFYAIIYSEDLGLFVAVGHNVIAISSDGMEWTKSYLTVYADFLGITYSKKLNLFVAVGKDNDVTNNCPIYTSSDGMNWVNRSLTSNTILNNIAYSKELNLFVAVGISKDLVNKKTRVVTSSDGINWNVKNIQSVGELKDVLYLNDIGLFVSISSTIVTSSDGMNWDVLIPNHTYPGSYDSVGFGVTFYEKFNLFIYCGTQGLWTSSDGINWESRISNSYWFGRKNVIYYEKLNSFIAISKDSGQLTNLIWTSLNGINWESRSVDFGIGYSVSINELIYSEDLELFVAVGNNGVIVTSSDGMNWNTQNSGTNRTLSCIVYSEELNLFVISGELVILTSSDGINWNSLSTNGSGVCITYSEELNLFVIGESNGNLRLSSDGINWITRAIPYSGATFYDITYSKELGLFMIVGSKDNIIMTPDMEVGNWIIVNKSNSTNTQNKYFSSVFVKELGYFIIFGILEIVKPGYVFNENIIDKLSEDSDMGFSLDIGENVILPISDEGFISGQLTYRQKYLGV